MKYDFWSAIKDFFKTGRFDVFPKQNFKEEIINEVTSLIDYVYTNDVPPPHNMPSKKYQKHILAQVYSIEGLYGYEDLANSVYKTAIKKENTYADIIDEEEFFAQMRFAMESLCFNIIQLTKDKENSRKHWSTIDNVTERLLQMNHDVFKPLFMLTHKWHFGYVYENDLDYQHHIKNIVRRLRLSHGIKQTDFYKLSSISKEDIQFTLYFGEKAGEIKRIKDGRTYRLYLPDDNIDEIPNYEFTRGATTEGDFNYKTYWKEISKVLKKNEGILQTDFYKLFSWDTEVLMTALREADKDGAVLREKKGNTYLLFLPKDDK